MKEDLIVIPEIDVFKTLITDARKDLSGLDLEDEELNERRELALDIVNILDEKLKVTKDLGAVVFKEKIWFAAHLYLLETILEDLFDEDDEMFFSEEEGEEDEVDHKN